MPPKTSKRKCPVFTVRPRNVNRQQHCLADVFGGKYHPEVCMDWKNGYVINMEYVHGVHRDLGPAALNLILLIQSIEPLVLQDGFTYCDLGCGQGESINLFAACHPEGEFHAVDFNSAHIEGARGLAGQADLENVTFWEADFVDLYELPLPAFDFIVIHGVYTWVGTEPRRCILEFLHNKLKPGGVVYLSYNSLPGWNVHAPLRELLTSYADTQSGPLEQRIDLAIEFVERLKAANAAVFETSPSTKYFFEYVCTLPRNYLAHEFFNRDWSLFYHADVVRDLAKAKLSFTGSANFAENQDLLMFSIAQQKILDEVTDKLMRETVKDFATNRLLRRDLFTGERMKMYPSLQLEHFLRCPFALVVPQTKLGHKALFPIGEVLFDRKLYDPILQAFELKPYCLEELLQCQEIGMLGKSQVLEALIVLLSAEYLMPAVEPTLYSVMTTRRLNCAILEREVDNLGEQFLASPVLQNAIKVDWLEQLLIICEINKNPDPLSYILEKMKTNKHKLCKDGKILQSMEECLEELAFQIETFRTCQLPLLQQLKIL